MLSAFFWLAIKTQRPGGGGSAASRMPPMRADGITAGAVTRRYRCNRDLVPMRRLQLELAAGENAYSGDAQKRCYYKGNERKPHGIAPRWRQSARGMSLQLTYVVLVPWAHRRR